MQHWMLPLLTWEMLMETIPWFFWDYLDEERPAESSANTDRHLVLPQMQFSRCDSCVRPSDIKILISLLLFLIRWHLPDELQENWWLLVIAGSGSWWIPIQAKIIKKKTHELRWTQLQLSIFGSVYFSSDLLIIPNYNNKYFNLVVALIITFILISRQRWHSNNAPDLME